MKKIVILATFSALAACGTGGTPVEETTGLIAADGGPSYGTFTVTNASGEVSTEVVSEDGTFVMTDPAGVVSTGTWEQRSPAEFCAKSEEDEDMTCYSETIDENGVWLSADPEDGEVSVITRITSAES